MPGEGLPYWPRLILGPCEKSYCTLLSDQVWTYYVHHAKKTYVPCFAEDGMPCEHCGPNGPRRVYQGSVPVWRQGSREIWLLNLTRHALQRCPELVERDDLAGELVVVWRAEGGRNAKMSAELQPRRRVEVPRQKRIPIDEVQKVQCNVWGVELVRPEQLGGRDND